MSDRPVAARLLIKAGDSVIRPDEAPFTGGQ